MATPDPAEFERLGERLADALLKLELRTREVQRLEARNAQLERDLKSLEHQYLNQTQGLIVLKEQIAEGRRGPLGPLRAIR
jgi:hypothetical protein